MHSCNLLDVIHSHPSWQSLNLGRGGTFKYMLVRMSQRRGWHFQQSNQNEAAHFLGFGGSGEQKWKDSWFSIIGAPPPPSCDPSSWGGHWGTQMKGEGILVRVCKIPLQLWRSWIFLVTSIPKEITVNCLCFKVVSCRSEKKLGLCQEFSSWGT